ncbi:MAG: hypothetical protein ACKO69_09045, partial [Limnohabitans sp.]
MARQTKLQKRKSRINILVSLFFFSLVIVGISTAVWWNLQRKPGLDSVTLCPAQGPIGQRVVLIDRTDPFNLAQKTSLDIFIKNLVDTTPPGQLLSVYVLGDDFKTNTKPLFELCNPGDGQEKSELTANLKALKQQYNKHFIEPMLSVTEGMVNVQPAHESPILEMLQLVNLNSIQKQKINGEIRLYVLSDMLQNSKSLSMYGNPVTFETYASSYASSKLFVDFSQVNVE